MKLRFCVRLTVEVGGYEGIHHAHVSRYEQIAGNLVLEGRERRVIPLDSITSDIRAIAVGHCIERLG